MNILRAFFYIAKGVQASKEYKGRPLDMVGDAVEGLFMAALIAIGFCIFLVVGIIWFFIRASHPDHNSYNSDKDITYSYNGAPQQKYIAAEKLAKKVVEDNKAKALMKAKSHEFDPSPLTITDVRTHLIWCRDAGIAGRKMGWEEAATWAKGLDYAGYRDWRLPTKNEVKLLLKHGGKGALNLFKDIGLSNVDSSMYWTSSVNPNNPDHALAIDLNDGHVAETQKSCAFFIWPVRDGQTRNTQMSIEGAPYSP